MACLVQARTVSAKFWTSPASPRRNADCSPDLARKNRTMHVHRAWLHTHVGKLTLQSTLSIVALWRLKHGERAEVNGGAFADPSPKCELARER